MVLGWVTRTDIFPVYPVWFYIQLFLLLENSSVITRDMFTILSQANLYFYVDVVCDHDSTGNDEQSISYTGMKWPVSLNERQWFRSFYVKKYECAFVLRLSVSHNDPFYLLDESSAARYSLFYIAVCIDDD